MKQTFVCNWLSLIVFFSIIASQVQAQVPGNALNFLGDQNYVDCGNNPSLQITGTALTLEAWINASTWTPNIFEGSIIVKDQSQPDNGYMLRCGDNGKVNFNIGNSQWYEVSTGSILKTGRWYHLAAVYNGTKMIIYVDGEEKASREYDGTIGSSETHLMIGESPYFHGRKFQGSIDEARIWNIARSKSEIQSTMHQELIGTESGLVGYYRFDQGIPGGINQTDTTLTDITSNMNNGTLKYFALTGNSSNWLHSYALVQPIADSATDITVTSFVAHWNPPSIGPTPSKYFIDVATDSEFTSIIMEYDNLDVGNVLSYTVTELAGGNYYYRVYAYYDSTAGLSQASLVTPVSLPIGPPLSGTIHVGSGNTMKSLTKAGGLFHNIIINGLSGDLTVLITSDLTESGQFNLTQWTEVGDSGFSITIQPDGTNEHIISGSANNNYGLIRLERVNNITIDGQYNGSGRYLRFRTTNNDGTPFGFFNGVNNIALRNCFIEGSPVGSHGFSPTNNANGLLFLKADSVSNNNIIINNNVFRDRTDSAEVAIPESGIYAEGSSGNNMVSIIDNQFLNIESYNIYSSGIRTARWLIDGNNFFATKPLNSFSAIELSFYSSLNDTIQNNYIGGQTTECGGSSMIVQNDVEGIYYRSSYDFMKVQSANKPRHSKSAVTGNVTVVNNVIQNISIVSNSSNSFYGLDIWSNGILRGNIIGHPTDSALGITIKCSGEQESDAIETSAGIIENNIIANIYLQGSAGEIVNNTSDYAPSLIALYVSSDSNTVLNSNKIYEVSGSGDIDVLTGIECYGIALTNIVNNVISLNLKDTTTICNELYGIYFEGSTNGGIHGNSNIYHNSIMLKATESPTNTISTFCFARSPYDSSFLTFKNNIFCNLTTGVEDHLIMYMGRLAEFSSDFNNFYTFQTDSLWYSTEQSSYGNFSTWKSTTGQDSHSSNIQPHFANIELGDLHLAGSSLGSIKFAGTPLEEVPTDIENNPRNDTYPYMGAYENTSVLIGQKVSKSYQMNAKWNMVSIPLELSDYSKTSIFPTATSSAFAYSGGYVDQTILNHHRGYWLKFSNAEMVSMTGYFLTEDTIIVNEGWNMIGGGSNDIAVLDLISLTTDLTVSQFFGYANGYQSVDTLKPATGYWVKANKTGQLLIPDGSSRFISSARIQVTRISEEPPPPPDLSNKQSQLPSSYTLSQNYPNPFNPNTVISYQLPVDSKVTLNVYNILGEVVITLVNEIQDAGYKSLSFDASYLPSGLYFYRIHAQTEDRMFTEMKKMILLK